jgi:hypothetical protein
MKHIQSRQLFESNDKVDHIAFHDRIYDLIEYHVNDTKHESPTQTFKLVKKYIHQYDWSHYYHEIIRLILYRLTPGEEHLYKAENWPKYIDCLKYIIKNADINKYQLYQDVKIEDSYISDPNAVAARLVELMPEEFEMYQDLDKKYDVF